MNLINNKSISLDRTFIGTVLKIDITTRECWVHIPELMMGLPTDTNYSNTYPVNLTHIKNANLLNLNDIYVKGNSLKVKAYDARAKMPAIGSLVSIEFIDNNIAYGCWRHFNPNNTCDYTENEKYSKLAKLTIGNMSIDICEDDNVTINLPDYFETVKTENYKDKVITVKDSSTDELAINKMQDTIKIMEKNFDSIVKRYKNLFISSMTKDSLTDASINNVLSAVKEITNTKLADINTVYDLYNTEDLYTNKLNCLTTINDNYKTIRERASYFNGLHTASVLTNSNWLDESSDFYKEITDYNTDYSEKYIDLYTINKTLVIKSSANDVITTVSSPYAEEITLPESTDAGNIMGFFTDTAFNIPYEFFINPEDNMPICEESTTIYACITSQTNGYNITTIKSKSDEKNYLIFAVEYVSNSDAEIISSAKVIIDGVEKDMVAQGNDTFTYEVSSDEIDDISEIDLTYTQYSKTITEKITVADITTNVVNSTEN